jgi:predicted amidohydrolase YtcJ
VKPPWNPSPSVDALENALAARGRSHPAEDWRKVVGMFGDSEFMRQVDEECERMRQAQREAAERGESPG